jgi:hypothetical protein
MLELFSRRILPTERSDYRDLHLYNSKSGENPPGGGIGDIRQSYLLSAAFSNYFRVPAWAFDLTSSSVDPSAQRHTFTFPGYSLSNTWYALAEVMTSKSRSASPDSWKPAVCFGSELTN